MKKVLPITKAKAKLSEIVNTIYYTKEEVVITKKGKKIAVIIPIEKYNSLKNGKEEGLICAKGALTGMEKEIEDMTHIIYEAREKENSREVNL